MSTRALASLAAPVRARVVLRHLGALAWSLAGLAGVPALVALGFGEIPFAAACAGVFAIFLAAGLGLKRLEAPADLRLNEGMAITALAFLLAALAMAWPLAVGGLPFADAFFEAVSGLTTTGLTMVSDPQAHSPAFLFTRAWLQWYGGLVIVVLALALAIEPGLIARRLAAAGGEVEGGDLIGSTRVRARQALGVYAALTGVGFLVVWPLSGKAFDSLVHVLAAVSTGGFSSHAEDIAGLGGWTVQAAVLAVAFSGSVSLLLYHRAWTGQEPLWRDPSIRALALAVLAATLLVATGMAASGKWTVEQILRNAPLLAVSAQTTTGFATLPPAGLDGLSKAVLILAMFVGGDAGSTAGGIKIVRLMLILALLRLALQRTALPGHAVAGLRVGGRTVEDPEARTMATMVFLFLATVFLSWLPFLAAGFAPLDALFDVVSAVATTGLSSGIAGPGLPLGLKLLLCFDMLAGRLEIVALLVLVYPRSWFGHRSAAS